MSCVCRGLRGIYIAGDDIIGRLNGFYEIGQFRTDDVVFFLNIIYIQDFILCK